MLQTDGIISDSHLRWQNYTDCDESPAYETPVRKGRDQVIGKRIASCVLALSFTVGVNSYSSADETKPCALPDSDEYAELLEAINDESNITTFHQERQRIGDWSAAAYDAFHRDTAANYGLTVYGYRAEFADLESDLYDVDESSIPGRHYLERAEDFFQRLGINLSIPKPGDFEELDPAHYIQESELDDRLVKRQLYELIRAYGDKPVEEIEAIGLTTILLHRAEGSIAGYVSGDTIHIDPFKPVRDVEEHEHWHAIDGAECPDYMADDAYDSHNPADFRYKNEAGNNLPYQNYPVLAASSLRESNANAEEQIYGHIAAGDFQQADELRARLEAFNEAVVVTDPYGFSNIAEDKAENGAEILQSTIDGYASYPGVFSNLNPIVRDKAITNLYRLSRLDSRLGKYYADILQAPYNKQDLTVYNPHKWQRTHEVSEAVAE